MLKFELYCFELGILLIELRFGIDKANNDSELTTIAIRLREMSTDKTALFLTLTLNLSLKTTIITIIIAIKIIITTNDRNILSCFPIELFTCNYSLD